jgi:hypothetical protein
MTELRVQERSDQPLHYALKPVLANCAIPVGSDATFSRWRARKVAIVPKSELDAIDSRIVAELQADARLSNVELADKWACRRRCLRRVKRLEREGYIEG